MDRDRGTGDYRCHIALAREAAYAKAGDDAQTPALFSGGIHCAPCAGRTHSLTLKHDETVVFVVLVREDKGDWAFCSERYWPEIWPVTTLILFDALCKLKSLRREACGCLTGRERYAKRTKLARCIWGDG